MIMRTKLVFGAISLVAAVELLAVPVHITRFSEYAISPGGEFTVTPLDDNGQWIVNPLYSSVALHTVEVNGVTLTGIQTFCLEGHENFTTYCDAVLNPEEAAVLGGVGPNGDPISVGTAYLYYMFATGKLKGYDYDPNGEREYSAYGVQNAIWYLEGEYVYSQDDAKPWLDLVNSLFVDPKADNAGTYPVGVLNMTYNNGTLAQDQLVLVPDGGLTLTLLGLGLAGLALGYRRVR